MDMASKDKVVVVVVVVGPSCLLTQSRMKGRAPAHSSLPTLTPCCCCALTEWMRMVCPGQSPEQ
jgi:hypothetical protein